MSPSTAQSSPYPRDNFFGDDTAPDESPPHGTLEGTDKDEWVSYSILRESGVGGDGTLFLCPECGDWAGDRYDPAENPGRLSEPELYPARTRTEIAPEIVIERYSDHRRVRFCRVCGLVTGGHIADRPTEAFREIVEAVLDHADPPPNLRDKLYSDAMALKGDGDRSDRAILASLLTDLRYGVGGHD